MEVVLLICLVFACVNGAAGFTIGDEKDAGAAGFIAGFVFGPVGLVIAYMLHGSRVRCRYCQMLIHKDAIKCPYCQSDV